jgi:hypothetical protein
VFAHGHSDQLRHLSAFPFRRIANPAWINSLPTLSRLPVRNN